MKKKILSLLVTMGLAASLVPVSVFADGTKVWDGSVAKSFAGGKGTKDDPYQIATGSQLAYFAERVNAGEYGEKYADTYFELTSDIDLGGKEWDPIGDTVTEKVILSKILPLEQKLRHAVVTYAVCSVRLAELSRT